MQMFNIWGEEKLVTVAFMCGGLCFLAKLKPSCITLIFEQPLFLATVVKYCQNFWWYLQNNFLFCTKLCQQIGMTVTKHVLFISYFSGGDRRSRKCHNSRPSGNSGKTYVKKSLTSNPISSQRIISVLHRAFGMTGIFSLYMRKTK